VVCGREVVRGARVIGRVHRCRASRAQNERDGAQNERDGSLHFPGFVRGRRSRREKVDDCRAPRRSIHFLGGCAGSARALVFGRASTLMGVSSSVRICRILIRETANDGYRKLRNGVLGFEECALEQQQDFWNCGVDQAI
jgi:hypothetical protein